MAGARNRADGVRGHRRFRQGRHAPRIRLGMAVTKRLAATLPEKDSLRLKFEHRSAAFSAPEGDPQILIAQTASGRHSAER
jgi:hypothetical protein